MNRIGCCLRRYYGRFQHSVFNSRSCWGNKACRGKKYEAISNVAEFVPVGVETFGTFGPGALELLKSINLLVPETGDRRAGGITSEMIEYCHHTWQHCRRKMVDRNCLCFKLLE